MASFSRASACGRENHMVKTPQMVRRGLPAPTTMKPAVNQYENHLWPEDEMGASTVNARGIVHAIKLPGVPFTRLEPSCIR